MKLLFHSSTVKRTLPAPHGLVIYLKWLVIFTDYRDLLANLLSIFKNNSLNRLQMHLTVYIYMNELLGTVVINADLLCSALSRLREPAILFHISNMSQTS